MIAIAGNHEFYTYYNIASLPDSKRWKLFPNVRICHNTVERIGDIDIIASTLWTHIVNTERYVSEHLKNGFNAVRFIEM